MDGIPKIGTAKDGMRGAQALMLDVLRGAQALREAVKTPSALALAMIVNVKIHHHRSNAGAGRKVKGAATQDAAAATTTTVTTVAEPWRRKIVVTDEARIGVMDKIRIAEEYRGRTTLVVNQAVDPLYQNP